MLKAAILSIMVLFSICASAASGPTEPSEFSQDFLLIFDLNHSGKLEQNELENVFDASSFGKTLQKCAQTESDRQLSLELWYFIFEKGSLPKTMTEKANFLAYTRQEHTGLAVDVKQIDGALNLFSTSCR